MVALFGALGTALLLEMNRTTFESEGELETRPASGDRLNPGWWRVIAAAAAGIRLLPSRLFGGTHVMTTRHSAAALDKGLAVVKPGA